MAISFFQQTATNSWDNFLIWLNANKAGTFLENATISVDSGSSSEPLLTINSDEITFRSKLCGNNRAMFVTYTDSVSTWSSSPPSYASANLNLTSAILCNKGLIFGFVGSTSASTSNVLGYSTALTVDSNSKLSAILASSILGTPSTLGAVAPGSTSKMSATCTPYYGANLTSIAPIAVQTTDPEQYLPYAFAAISTSLNSAGLNSVVINGENYITNGVWYIKDGE